MSGTGSDATAVVAAPQHIVYRVVTTVDPTRFYPRFGPLPAVVGVRGGNGWDSPGLSRVLELSDGGTVREQIDDVDAPSLFAYDLDEFTGPFGRIVAGARSEWTFSPDAGGTRIHWSYRFSAQPGWRFVVAAIVRFAWAPYMRRVLPAIAAAVPRAVA